MQQPTKPSVKSTDKTNSTLQTSEKVTIQKQTVYTRMQQDLLKLTSKLKNRNTNLITNPSNYAKVQVQKNILDTAQTQNQKINNLTNHSVSRQSSQNQISTNRTFQNIKNNQGHFQKIKILKLLDQNHNLSDRIWELESECDQLGKLLKESQIKYKRKMEGIWIRFNEQMRQKVYCEKLAGYYKIKAEDYRKILLQNGIQVYGQELESDIQSQREYQF